MSPCRADSISLWTKSTKEVNSPIRFSIWDEASFKPFISPVKELCACSTSSRIILETDSKFSAMPRHLCTRGDRVFPSRVMKIIPTSKNILAINAKKIIERSTTSSKIGIVPPIHCLERIFTRCSRYNIVNNSTPSGVLVNVWQ